MSDTPRKIAVIVALDARAGSQALCHIVSRADTMS